jgi:uncharacterized protein (TIGR02145 family)
MKKIYAMIFLVLALLKVQGQDYYISFAGSGAATTVDSVKVDNLTSGSSFTLKGSDILHLIPSLGIGAINAENRYLHLYPNPMEEQSTLDIVTSGTGTSTISLVNLSGQTVYQISEGFTPGVHSFRVSGIQQGIYIVKVKGSDFFYSTKLVSLCNLPGETRIELVNSVPGSEGRQLKNAAATIDMSYTNGNILKFKGTTGQYSTVVSDIPTGSKTITYSFVACTDIDGNNYATIRIGTGKSGAQTWMAENLNVGTLIPLSQPQTNNGITEKYCYSDFDLNCSIYGGLYQWNEMMQYADTLGAKGICPDGWHISTVDEWGYLLNYLGGREVVGGKLKATGTSGWLSPNIGATNESGFTALPAGWFDSVFAHGFSEIGETTGFWTSLTKSGMFMDYYFLGLSYNWYFVYILKTPPTTDGFSVRCVADKN